VCENQPAKGTLMTTVDALPTILQWLFGERANELGRESGFIERKRKWSGSSFARGLVLGWMEKPQGSLSELNRMASDCGCEVSNKTLWTRLAEAKATGFMRGLLEEALRVTVKQAVSDDDPTPLKFAQVVLLDSTQVTLPVSLQAQYPGGGNQNQARAGIKIQTFYEWRQGALHFDLHPAVHSDRNLPMMALETGSLVVQDCGFLSVKHSQAVEQQQCYWLSRMSANMGICDENGRHYSLSHYLQTHALGEYLDAWVGLTRQNHPVRLLAIRLPDDIAQLRQERLIAETLRRRNRPPKPDNLVLCQWFVMVTNAPQDLLPVSHALFLYRSRWQIELLFKLWKQHGSLDEWRTAHPQRIQTELFAKLLMLLVQHWLLVDTCWQWADRSLAKAVNTLQRYIVLLAKAFFSLTALTDVLDNIANALRSCRLSKRSQRPSFFQLLEALT
jgi:hypothetical protein